MAALVRMRTKLKNKIHSIVLMKGIATISNTLDHSHSFAHQHIEKLIQINNYRITSYIHLIESLDTEIKDTSKEILSIVKEDEMAKLLLMTIPGIGHCYSALLIVSEIGDIYRFSDSYHLC
jgi:transposase